MPHFSTMRATFLCKIRYLNIGAKNQQSFLSKTVWLIISNIVKLNPKKDRSEGMNSRFQECMWKGINSQYIYWIYRLFSSPFKFKKLKEFFLCIRKWCCIVQEIVVHSSSALLICQWRARASKGCLLSLSKNGHLLMAKHDV